MAEKSSIEWTEATWNPITGCTLVSDGCRHCYAARLAATRLKHQPSRRGLARLNAAGEAKFTGEVRFNEDWLDQPLRWKRPRMIFVCAHGDLFHESVPDEWIDRIFAVMALAPQHTFQVLTKRAKRMREYVSARYSQPVSPLVGEMPGRAERGNPGGDVARPSAMAPGVPRSESQTVGFQPPSATACHPNVWLGVSAEDQATADERIPDLLATPAAIRYVSAEPLLGPIDFCATSATMPAENHPWLNGPILQGIDQIIVGGESGDKARPMHPDWARSIRDQCAAADVAFFFKQWGEWLPWEPEHDPCWVSQNRRSEDRHILFPADSENAPDWDDGLWAVGNGECHAAFQRVGKKTAGRLLDGVVHNGMPAPMEIPAL